MKFSVELGNLLNCSPDGLRLWTVDFSLFVHFLNSFVVGLCSPKHVLMFQGLKI